MQATAAVLRAQGAPFALETVQIEAPRPGEILVRIVAVGMCHTDIAAQEGLFPSPLPLILGHEGAGVVEAVGDGVTKVAPGDHVVLTYLSCGSCRNCVSGRQSYCESVFPLNFSGARPDGSSPTTDANGESVFGRFFGQSSFASYSLASERNVVKAPKDMDLSLLGPLGCGVQTGAGAVINVLKPEPGAWFAVFGTGAVGMSAIMAAKTLGVTKVIAIDIVQERLDLALELGASHAFNGKDEPDLPARLKELTGRGVDFALETTGVPHVLSQAVDALAIPGSCGVVGAAGPDAEVSLGMASLMMGKRILGIVEGESTPDILIPHLMDLMRAGAFPLERLVKRYPLSAINQAVKDAASGRVIKPILEP